MRGAGRRDRLRLMKRGRRTAVLAILLGAWACAIGAGACTDRPAPVETMRRVATGGMPLLHKGTPSARVLAILPAGEFVETGRGLGQRTWSGKVGDEVLSREGEMVELLRTSAGRPGFGFVADLTGEVAVPTADWDCSRIGAAAGCPDRLVRIQTETGLFAYDFCHVGTCAVATLQGTQATSVGVENLSQLEFASVAGRLLALATSRWVREPQWTGATIRVFTVEPALRELAAVTTEEVDARGDPVRRLDAQLTVEGAGAVLHGTRVTIDLASGTTLAEEPIKQPVPLGD